MCGEDEMSLHAHKNCLLCGLTFVAEARTFKYCAECRTAVPGEVRDAMYKNKWRLKLYRYVLHTTGARVPIKNTIENRKRYDMLCCHAEEKSVWHTADECPRSCRYLGKCGSDDCCDYILMTGHSRPKESGPVGRECKEFIPITEEDKKKRRKDRWQCLN